MEAITQETETIVIDLKFESDAFEIIECPQCHWPAKIPKGTCSRCGRCGEKIGHCDE